MQVFKFLFVSGNMRKEMCFSQGDSDLNLRKLHFMDLFT